MRMLAGHIVGHYTMQRLLCLAWFAALSVPIREIFVKPRAVMIYGTSFGEQATKMEAVTSDCDGLSMPATRIQWRKYAAQ
jgi:hypothetical protein